MAKESTTIVTRNTTTKQLLEAFTEFIREHGFPAFAKWRLEINSEKGEHTKGRYEFPYGDFRNVHRCAVISAESRAGQYKHFERAAAQLHEMIDEKKGKKARKAHA